MKKRVLIFLTLVLVLAFASAALAMPTINSVYLEEADNFYSPCEGNDIVHVIANITNSSALVVANATFDESITCDGSNTIALSDNGDGTWSGECNVSDEAAVSNFEEAAITIIAVEQEDPLNPAIDSSTHILLYNMTTPPEQEGSCDRFGSETTNFCEELDFSDVHFVTEIETNGTCQSQFIGQELPWEDFKPVVKFEFGSLDFSAQETLDALSGLGNALHVEITPPGSFGDSLVGVDTMAFAALNTETNISLYGLPFATEPLICEYGSENCGEEAGISGVNYTLYSPYVIEITCGDVCYDECEEDEECFDNCMIEEGCANEEQILFTQYVPNGTLEFTVSHFSDYSISDDEAPTVEITSPSAEGSVGAKFDVVADINGTGSQISSVTIYNYDEIIAEYDYIDLFSYCTNNDEGWTALTCTFPISLQTDEDLNLTVEAIDFAGLGGLMGSDNVEPVYFDLCGSEVEQDFVLTRDWDCSGYEGDAVTISADGVTFDCAGHNITGAGAYAWEGDEIYPAGIRITGSSATVKNCNFAELDYGVYIEGGDNATVQNNTIINMDTGIWGYTSTEGWIKAIGNEISWDGVNENAGYVGININSGYDGDVVYDNYIHDLQGDGILLSFVINANVSDNILEEIQNYGIYLNYVYAADVVGNIFNNTEISGAWGIYSQYSDDVTIEDNIIDGAGYAITVDQSSEGTRVVGNTISGAESGGIRIEMSNGAEVSENEISLASGNESYGILLRGEGKLSNHIVDGNTITIPGGEFSGNQYGIIVRDDSNELSENTIECIGPISDGYTYGIYIGPQVGENVENNALFGNEISGCDYGLYANQVDNFTANDESYHDNYYGAYLDSAGSDEIMPEISNSHFYDNADYGVYLTGAYAEINDCVFESNGESEGDAGLDVDGTSTAYVTDGDFIGNILHGMYDEGPDYIYWTILDHAICRDNDISIWTDGEDITFDGGTLELDNCTITINDEVVLDSDGNYTSLTVAQEDVVANESTELDFGEEDTNITLFLGDNVSVTVSVSATEPTASGTTSGMIAVKGVSIEVDDTTEGALTWALIKIFYDDAELEELNIDESTLKIYFYNATAGDWQLEPNQGVETTANYVWVNVTHFSIFGMFGEELAEEEEEEEEEERVSPGGGGVIPTTHVLGDEPATFTLRTSDTVKFTINGEQHSVRVRSIHSDYVTMRITSNSIDFDLYIGETKKIDVNSDNIYDLALTLKSITGATASMLFQKIAEPIQKEEVPAEAVEEKPPTVPEITPPAAEKEKAALKAKLLWLWIAIAVIIVVAAAYIVLTRKNHKRTAH